MSDDFISLKILVISEVDSDRALLRSAATEASVPIEITEIPQSMDHFAACEALEQGAFDFLFIDSRMPMLGRKAVLEAARKTAGQPLYILIGAAEMKTRKVLTDGLAVDGALAKPIDPSELNKLMASCVRARIPSRVLVVDDSSTVRSVVRKVLQASRYRLNADDVSDGRTALERAGREHFDFVFLDCNMPDFDGFATLDELQRRHANTSVVMITGTNDIRLADKARAGGAKELLVKPFYAKDIDAVLSRLYGLMPAVGT